VRAIFISVHANRPLRALTAALAFSIVAAPHGARAAAIVISGRTTTETVSFSDTSAFSDASLTNSSALTISGNTGDTYQNWSIPDGATDFTATATGPFSVTSPVQISGTPNNTESFTVTALATPSSGTLTLAGTLGVNVAPSGAETTLSTGVSGGYNFLDVTFDPTAPQSNGSSFTFTADITGNYSGTGVGTGDHELVSLNPNWTINQNFVYNGTRTVFSASIADYIPPSGTNVNDQIGLQYQIYGAPVPLPASAWLLLSALGGLGVMVRKRRTA
jgi:hypothetical protein